MTPVATPEETVHDRARRVVRAAEMSQREFAERIGLNQTALSKARRGTRRLTDDEIGAIARVGGVPRRYLERSGAPIPARLARAEARQPRARADPVPAEVRRAQILEATAQLIARKGFHRVRIAHIAHVCETSTGTLLYHFESKDEALREALVHYAERLHTRLESEFETTSDPVEKLRRLIEVQLPISQEDVDEWSVWVQSWNEAMFEPDLRASQERSYARWRQTVKDLIVKCQAAGLAADADADADADALACRFTAIVDGLALQVLASTSDMTIAVMRDLLTDGLEPHLSLRRSER